MDGQIQDRLLICFTVVGLSMALPCLYLELYRPELRPDPERLRQIWLVFSVIALGLEIKAGWRAFAKNPIGSVVVVVFGILSVPTYAAFWIWKKIRPLKTKGDYHGK